MENNDNKYITVTYELYVDNDGQESLVEQTPAEHPFQFVSGMGITLEAFEANIVKLNKGDKFDFIIPMAEAYGEIDPTHILDLPKHFFEIDGQFDSKRVFAGNIIPMINSDGNHLNGTVLEVKEDTVRMDFNHPFAGKDLHFVGTVTELRPATNAEIQEVVNMFAGEGCGGGCDCCGGGCGDDCGSGHGHHGCGCDCHS
mgnify:FL=1